MTSPLRVGMVGCGVISGAYVSTLDSLPGVDLVACADLRPDRAEEVAASSTAARAASVEEVVGADDVDVVLNLTVPTAHAAVTAAALAAGKHAYGEKPLATTVEDGRRLLDTATSAGLLLGCAPDTVLGTGIQTARAALDRGDIGTPVGASAFIVGGGPEDFHASPQFFYQPGGGPLFDMGPYYVTALVTLLGPVHRVVAMARSASPRRRVLTGPDEGSEFDVAVDTHVTALLEHHSGVQSTVVTSWDAPAGGALPRIEVYGDAATLGVPDPNLFAGPVRIRTEWEGDWSTVPVCAGYRDRQRGIGLADLATARASGGQPRASAVLALHVLEVMQAALTAAGSGAAVVVESTTERPAPVPLTDLSA